MPTTIGAWFANDVTDVPTDEDDDMDICWCCECCGWEARMGTMPDTGEVPVPASDVFGPVGVWALFGRGVLGFLPFTCRVKSRFQLACTQGRDVSCI